MDAEVPELGSGTEPTDRAVWGKTDPIFIKRKARAAIAQAGRPSLNPLALIGLPENPKPYSGGRVRAEPTKKQFLQCLVLMKKIRTECIKNQILAILLAGTIFDSGKSIKSTGNIYISNSYQRKLNFHRHKIFYSLSVFPLTFDNHIIPFLSFSPHPIVLPSRFWQR